jgi:hypothetical protein
VIKEDGMFVGLNMSGSTLHFKTSGRFLGDVEILDEHVLYQKGSYKHVKRWLRGVHPELGLITRSGITGELETVQEADVIMAMRTFTVSE